LHRVPFFGSYQVNSLAQEPANQPFKEKAGGPCDPPAVKMNLD
jgi:hypothetical protein